MPQYDCELQSISRWLDPDENAPQFAGADLNSGLCISNMADHKFYPARVNETNLYPGASCCYSCNSKHK